MGDLRIEPTGATLGATVTGVRLAGLSDDDWRAIEAAFHEHGVLIFPGQHLSQDEQVAFGARFGELSIEILLLSNRRDDGTLVPPDDPLATILAGNEGWHTDSSFRYLAAKASILSAREVPSEGGETEWADMRAAYDALDPEVQERLAGLSAHHSLEYSQSKVGGTATDTRSGLAALTYVNAGSGSSAPAAGSAPPVGSARPDPLRPLVKVHPVTGRPALFIGRHAYGIPGLSPEESERLLTDLVEAACQPPRVWRHRWQPGDLVVWDNRCLLHRARPYDPTQGRVMVHTRVGGDPATELATEPAAEPAAG